MSVSGLDESHKPSAPCGRAPSYNGGGLAPRSAWSGAWIAAAVALSLAAPASAASEPDPGPAAQAAQASARAQLPVRAAAETQDRVAWVKRVEDQDFFFWRRYAYRLTRRNEFDLDERWYQPNEMINGGIGQPLPRRPAAQRTISPAAWAAASKYAFDHKASVLVVVRHGAVEYEQWTNGHAPGTVESLHSFSKTLVALLTGIAISEGKIASLDAPIGDYIAEWKHDPRGRITVRDLLQGSSGLEKVPFGLDPTNKMLRLAEDRDVNKAALAFDLATSPGKAFSYNSVDTQLAGLVLERATGEAYGSYLSSRLWKPLGNAPANVVVDELGHARTFCCIRSTAEDWLRVGEMMLHQGRWRGRQIVPAAWLREMATPSTVNPYFGLQLSIGRTGSAPIEARQAALMVHPQKAPYAAKGVVFLTGAADVDLWIAPSADLVVLRLGDYDADYDTSVIVNDLLAGIRK